MNENATYQILESAWGDIVNRSEPYFDDISVSYQRYQYASMRRDRLDGRFLPVYDNEVDLAVIRAMCRLMHERVPMAKAKANRLIDYTISRGFDWAVTHENKELGHQLSAIVKRVLTDNKWIVIGERDSFRQECVDGEWLCELATLDGQIVMNTLTGDALVEPANCRQLEEWQGIEFDASWTFGVLSRKYRPQHPLGYHIVRDDGGEDWDFLPARRALHWNRNVPQTAKRGFGNYYTEHIYLGRADKVLANTAEGAAVQAAIAYIVEHVEGTTSVQAQSIVNAMLNINSNRGPNGQTRAKKITPGQRLDIPAGMKYHAGLFGSNNSQIYIQVMEALLRLAGTIEAFPEHMLTGDAGNNNYASALVAESPFVQGRLADQEVRKMRVVELIEKVIRFALDHGVMRGYSWADVEPGLKVTVQPPQIISRDPAVLTTAIEKQKALKLISDQTASQQLGLDYEQEQSNLKREEALKPQPQPGMPGAPPAPGQPAPPPGLPAPAPVQGQGVQAPLGESLRESTWDESKHPRGPDGKFVSAGIDTSKWNLNNSSAKWAKTMISKMEHLAAAGMWSELEAAYEKSKTAKSINSYQNGVLKAKANLLKLKDKADVKVEPPKPASDWQKLGGSLGTQPGGTYQGPDGKKYYVKLPNDPELASNEYLAFKLYGLAGAGTVTPSLALIDGKLGIATQWMESGKVDWSSAKSRDAASKDFAVHAWLANWDAVGAGSENPMDNIRIDAASGAFKLVDAGGSLNRKGTGGLKPFGEAVSEWDTLRDSTVNPSMAKVFGQMTPQQLIDSGEKLKNVSDQAISQLVDQAGPPEAADREKLKATLSKRRDAILAKVAALKANQQPAATTVTPEPVQAPAVPAPLAQPPAEPPVTPTVIKAAPMGIPAAPKIMSAANQGYQKHLDAIHAAALAGNVAGVNTVPSNPDSKQTYAKKVHAYKQQVLLAMGSKPIAGTPVAPTVAAPAVVPPPTKLPIMPYFGLPASKEWAAKAEKLAQEGKLAELKALNPPTTAVKLSMYHEDLIKALGGKYEPGYTPATTPAPLPPAPAAAPVVTQAAVGPKKFDMPPPPEFISKNADQVKQNKFFASQAHAFAQAGNLDMLKAMTPPPSPKAKNYHSSLVTELSNTLFPPPPPPEMKVVEEYAKLGDAIPKAPMPGAKKVGYWAVVGSTSITEHPVPGEYMPSGSASLWNAGESAWSKLPAGEKSSLKSYTGGGYGAINSYLRGVTQTDKGARAAKRAVAGIVKAAVPLQVGLKLSRKHGGDISSLKPGDVVADAGLLSTSTSSNVWSGDNQWHMVVAPGVKGLPAKQFSSHSSENEVILPPNTRIMVTQIKPKSYGGHEVHAVILPN